MASKTLIAVVNCQSRKKWAQAIRDTWKPLLQSEKVDVLFFRGNPWEVSIPAEEDVIQLNCDDTYQGLPEKVRSIIRWAFNHGYDYVLKCDDDVVLRPEILTLSEYERHKYSGRANRPGKVVVPYGFNYWMSRECLGHLYNAPLPPSGNDDEKWVAETLFEKGIMLSPTSGYHLYLGTLIDRSKENYGYRPLNVNRKDLSTEPGSFSWAIYLTAYGDNRVDEQHKIDTFYRLFAERVGSTNEQVLKNQELSN